MTTSTFKKQSGKTFQHDVLIIGSGLAGMHYALQILELQPHLKIAMICKADAMECNSRYAQGGIAAVTDPLDSVEQHIKDTVVAGAGLSFQPHVACIVQQGPQAIQDLLRYKVPFAQDKAGHFILAK